MAAAALMADSKDTNKNMPPPSKACKYTKPTFSSISDENMVAAALMADSKDTNKNMPPPSKACKYTNWCIFIALEADNILCNK